MCCLCILFQYFTSKNVLRNCTENIVSKTAVNIVTYPRLVTTRPVPVKGVALMGGNCLCVKKVNEIVKEGE